MNPLLAGGLAWLVMELFSLFLKKASFIEWGRIEGALGPALASAGCKDVEVRAVDGMAVLSVQREVLGVWLPLEFDIVPLGLRFDENVRLGLALRDARVLRPGGLKGWFVYWAVLLWFLWKRTTLGGLVVALLREQVDMLEEEDGYWFNLDEVEPFDKLAEIRAKAPLVPLNRIVICDGVYVKERGLQFDIGAGPWLRAAEPLLGPIMRGVMRRK